MPPAEPHQITSRIAAFAICRIRHTPLVAERTTDRGTVQNQAAATVDVTNPVEVLDELRISGRRPARCRKSPRHDSRCSQRNSE